LDTGVSRIHATVDVDAPIQSDDAAEREQLAEHWLEPLECSDECRGAAIGNGVVDIVLVSF
jgi:hypothetical protein